MAYARYARTGRRSRRSYSSRRQSVWVRGTFTPPTTPVAGNAVVLDLLPDESMGNTDRAGSTVMRIRGNIGVEVDGVSAGDLGLGDAFAFGIAVAATTASPSAGDEPNNWQWLYYDVHSPATFFSRHASSSGAIVWFGLRLDVKASRRITQPLETLKFSIGYYPVGAHVLQDYRVTTSTLLKLS